jgi:hypothetical protein
MQKRSPPIDPLLRRRALEVLRSGRVTLPEMAAILGVSTHRVWNWCREAGVDWRKVRRATVAKIWRKLNNGND